MRILFTFTGGRGHAEPLVPIALAAATFGHEIAMASAAEAVPQIAAAGITAFATSELLPPRPEIPGESEELEERTAPQRLAPLSLSPAASPKATHCVAPTGTPLRSRMWPASGSRTL